MNHNNTIDLVNDHNISKLLEEARFIPKSTDQTVEFPVYESKKKSSLPKILVLSGGGTRGIAQLGSLIYLHEKGLLRNISVYAGSSVGSILCLMLCIGYPPVELFQIISALDMKKFKSVKILNIFSSYGIDDGKSLEYIVTKILEFKQFNPNITFKELYEQTKKMLIIPAVSIYDVEPHYFSYKTTPDLGVLQAVRMSVSIPLYYTPVKYNDCYYVDAGCCDNFPIHIFQHCSHDVIGIKISSSDKTKFKVNNLFDYIRLLTRLFFSNKKTDSNVIYNKIISLNCSKFSMLNYNMTEEEKLELFQTGYLQTKHQLETDDIC